MAVVTKSGAGMTSEWVFENNPRMGGATGEAFTNTLASSGMAPASVLAREAIQNSVDARAEEDSKVRVDFVARRLTGKAKSAFVSAARLTEIAARADGLGFKQPNCISDLADGKKPLDLLFVDDFETTGLAGDPEDSESKFSRFLLSLGDGGKEHSEHGTGGSYGFGKSVYSSNSGVTTIFAYSRTVDGEGEPLSLLFGCGYYRKHKHDGVGFTGRAWFGIDRTEPQSHAQQLVVPFRGAEADKLAAVLGFTHRDPEELGTSVLIVDATVKAADILTGVEDWWWPRLLTGQLDVSVVPADGEPVFPRPRKRADLKPFLEAFETAVGKSPADGKRTFYKPFNKSQGSVIGTSGFVVLERDDKERLPVPDERVDTVALIRSPLMVVAYYRQWMTGNPAMVGAFFGAPDIDDTLRAAEPPAHDRWDKDANRLQEPTGRRRQLVETVLGGLRRTIKLCQSTASPPPPPRPKRLSILERTLASFLAPAKKGTQGGGDVAAAPIGLHYSKQPRPERVGTELVLKASFGVELKPEENVDELEVRVRVSCPVIEDGSVGDDLDLAMTSTVDLSDDAHQPGWKRFVLKQGHPAKFECESVPYDPLWTVRFVPEVEPVGGAS